MTEDEARAWLTARYDDIILTRLTQYTDLLVQETARQNLIAPSTLLALWARHLVDSAQLILHAPEDWRHWVDIGSGAGLPGLVVAIVTGGHVTLIEPRRLRVDFLQRCRAELTLDRVEIVQSKAHLATGVGQADIVSARAVANLSALFDGSRQFAPRSTTFILPKGESAQSEVAEVQKTWTGAFHVEQSVVDPRSGIVIAKEISPR